MVQFVEGPAGHCAKHPPRASYPVLLARLTDAGAGDAFEPAVDYLSNRNATRAEWIMRETADWLAAYDAEDDGQDPFNGCEGDADRLFARALWSLYSDAQALDAGDLRVCPDCGALVEYSVARGDWQHVNASAPPCFLAKSRTCCPECDTGAHVVDVEPGIVECRLCLRSMPTT
jgi:hypothetical protein